MNNKNVLNVLIGMALLLLSLSGLTVSAQVTTTADRLKAIEERLRNLSVTVPGLNQPVQLSMSGASAQEFLRALAQSNNLNINIDPQLNFKVYTNFRNETAMNVILFMAKEYDLDINLIGSIMSVTKVQVPKPAVVPKDFRVNYNASNEYLGFELNNDTLSQVAKKISQLSQKNVVVPVALMGKKVSGFIAAAPFEVALEKLAYANELKMNKTNDGVFIFQSLGEGEELYVNGDNATAVKRGNKGAAQSGPSNFSLNGKKDAQGNRTVSVDALNTPILDLIKSASSEVGANYFIYSDIKGTVSTRLSGIGYDTFLTALLQGTEYTFKKDGGVYLIGDRKLEGLRANRIVQLQHRSLDTIQMMIPNEWKRGVEIKEFREQNTLLLSGSSPQVNEIENYIKQIDRVVPMVLIEVTLVDVRKGKSVKTGISAGVSDSVRTGGTILPGIDYTFGANSINNFLSKLGRNGAVNLGRVTPNFYVKLSALENNNNVDIRSVPKLSTLNGHSANLSIGSSRYYSQRTQNVIPSLNAQTVVTEQFTEVNANLEIDIRPVVSGDDQVTLNIKVNISDFIGNPPLNAPPPKSTSKFSSIIRAKNEDMIVLGGLERTESSESGSGIPILSRIPVLKWLFSSREKSNNKVVTLVFIKPTILY
ncbi:Type II secretion system protein D [Pedobacter sp. Bi27]|uniref:type II secretion system protein GspD n=1 Tax=unclassified Pedobacter TaxID=2628915 RepID=UPI001D904C9C|nr:MULTISPECIES: type II and III secretion system protein [unclassified Pedobacter]CAH0304124.1 Type II secretion system protein D [Pedobacter sp. Bi36]CAH0312749.1 Type II secretion system protein D [Pedobacter sp. Bi27]CAH0313308.1 Type II secretion system protein D [Pedobacter sp. Bi126]